jgi:hypothetical protein
MTAVIFMSRQFSYKVPEQRDKPPQIKIHGEKSVAGESVRLILIDELADSPAFDTAAKDGRP